MPFDVREIANFILDTSWEDNLPVTNLSLNKIIYFLHSWHLVTNAKPLVSAKIEAWEYGPVFREIYREFKSFGDQPISQKANKVDLSTGELRECEYNFTDAQLEFLVPLTKRYIAIPPFALVSLSHETDGPWDKVWNSNKKINPGMRITDDLITQHFDTKSRH